MIKASIYENLELTGYDSFQCQIFLSDDSCLEIEGSFSPYEDSYWEYNRSTGNDYEVTVWGVEQVTFNEVKHYDHEGEFLGFGFPVEFLKVSLARELERDLQWDLSDLFQKMVEQEQKEVY